MVPPTGPPTRGRRARHAQNDVSEKEQRKGAKTIEASTAPKDAIDIASLRQTVVKTNEEIVRKNYESKYDQPLPA